jgi:hypothetical protein
MKIVLNHERESGVWTRACYLHIAPHVEEGVRARLGARVAYFFFWEGVNL